MDDVSDSNNSECSETSSGHGKRIGGTATPPLPTHGHGDGTPPPEEQPDDPPEVPAPEPPSEHADRVRDGDRTTERGNRINQEFMGGGIFYYGGIAKPYFRFRCCNTDHTNCFREKAAYPSPQAWRVNQGRCLGWGAAWILAGMDMPQEAHATYSPHVMERQDSRALGVEWYGDDWRALESKEAPKLSPTDPDEPLVFFDG